MKIIILKSIINSFNNSQINTSNNNIDSIH